MPYQYLSTEKKTATLKSGQTAEYTLVTLNSPPMNALASGVFHDLDKLITELESARTRLAIITGAGKAFVAGADISEMRGMSVAAAKVYSELGHRIFSRMEASPVIFIAAVNGFAFGGGLELAMAADIRIFADSAQVGLPEPTLGLIPGFGGTQRLQRLVGLSNAAYLSLTSERIGADDALRIGLAAKVSPLANLIADAEAVALKVLTSGPQAIRILKHTILNGGDKPMPQALEFEAEQFSQLFSGAEAHEGLAAFLEKRPAKF
ncbi:enoyl-CoA hydratase/isomerase family protein [Turneriella parva]|uniref:Enoyl-CoA hydratase/isomerase n=1 Tax=Turneriella parva (strain ATCC BAA-1111 / DSM 21527 / NCTC 11395 / H) TaxID=869212 RepID=I4BBX8_TURPD|nr:enoyl-CoA hydratase-related protein [Turneriella parva]AFM14785.1 Enoyl-CoA hydratase/isomerase [Turneriella parva DSM 21527]